jgi:hypothetical protein
MSLKETYFPQYRMLANGKSIYKILDDRNFIEIQIIGSKKKKFEIKAEQYPEILKIQDILNDQEDIYIKIDEKKWLEFQ